MGFLRIAAVCTAALFASAVVAETLPEPRAISDAERAAVQIAGDFLARGPEAFSDRLAGSSPLREFSSAEVLREIEVRTGPHAGAVWSLQTVVPSLRDKMAVFEIAFPSGLDDTLIVEMVSESGTYKVQNLRILAEPTPAAIRPQEPLLSETTTADSQNHSSTRVLLLGLIGALCAIGSAFLRREPAPARIKTKRPPPVSPVRRFGPPALTVSAVLLVGGGIAVAMLSDPRFRSTAPPVESKPPVRIVRGSLGSLAPLRNAIATGTSDASEHFTAEHLQHDAARLWKAQLDLQYMRVEEVEKTLAAFPPPSSIPLAEILRGRLGFFRSREVDAVLAYERAINLGPGRDALWHEAAQILAILGFEDLSKQYLNRLARMGSRDADVYYTLARHSAWKDQLERAEVMLTRAWNLRPVERASLIDAAVLWEVIRQPKVAALVKLSAAQEATFASPNVSKHPVEMPAGAVTRVSGDFLHIAIGDQELLVPGGAVLAPIGTPAVDAAEWSRTEASRALQQLPNLLGTTRTAGLFTQPAMRRKIEATASALAGHNRWNDLIALTDALAPSNEHVPTELFMLRGTALQRQRRFSDARRLYAELAVSRAVQRKNDARTLLQLGEMLQSVDLWSTAMKLMERAGRIREIPYLDERLNQISMNQRLATAFELHATKNFDVRYPTDMSRVSAGSIGTILEKEFERITKQVPITSFERVTVNILPWNEFRNTYTGSDHIVGFYNGKITLPFAGLPVYIPEIVAILSHELTHAIVAQATADNAPRWFQEGIAQRLEMVPYHSNAFNMYEDDKLFSLAVLDSVMNGSPDPEMMQEAYIESQTVIRFIESRHGWKGVQNLIASFRSGGTTEEAFQQLWGQSVADFDLQLRAWGRVEARVFENPPPIIYYDDPNTQIRFGPSKSGAKALGYQGRQQ